MATLRTALDQARQQHLSAIWRAIGAGTPYTELEDDLDAFRRAATQLTVLAR